jgi:peptidylprolyl isomerase
MASKSQRAMALILAVLFLATSVATGAVVIWQLREDNKAKQTDSSLSDTSPSTINQDGEQLNQQEGQENMLKGTKLTNYEPTGEVTTLHKNDLVVGTGEEVKPGATVTVHYTGAYASNGEIFESSKDSGQTATFPLSSVIKGWTDGVPGMKVGGTRRLIIPGDQAYGLAPAGYTPGSTDRPMGTLVFDIEVTAVEQ